MVNFLSPGLVDKYADQFAPYRAFGCDMRSEYDGTIFRLPLRTGAQAESSRIAKRACSPAMAENLVREFVDQLPELCLFLTHIHTVEVGVWRAGEAAPEQLCRINVRDHATGRPPERQRLHQLVAAAKNDLHALEQIESSSVLSVGVRNCEDGPCRSCRWLVAQSMGGGRALELCNDPLAKSYGLQPLPWSGVAAPIGREEDGVSMDDQPCVGKPYCLLPLNTTTGLPVHINGFFELSSNRRDIWHGDDLVGGGKMRADWNRALLEDVAAPSYAQLLLYARRTLGGGASYYALWPQQPTAEPWRGMVSVLYRMLLKQPVLHSAAQGGSWVSPTAAVFAEVAGGGEEAAPAPMHAVLLRSGVPLVVVPAAVHSQLHEAAVASGAALRWASGALVRDWLRGHGGWEEGLSREEAVVVLRHVLSGLEGDALREACGLRLLPLVSGGWASLCAVGTGNAGGAPPPPLLLCAGAERGLLMPHAQLVVDVELESPLGELLRVVAASRMTNLKVFSAGLLPSLLPALLPAHWRGVELAEVREEGGAASEAGGEGAGGAVGEPTMGWLLELWEFIGRQHSELPLGALAGWPLVPVEGGRAYALPSLSEEGGGSRLLELGGVGEVLVRALRRAGCLGLDARVSRAHPELSEYVHAPSACAVLRAVLAAAGGEARGAGAQVELLSLPERRAVRALLAERRHVEERALRADAALCPLLLSLPLFELHGGAAGGGSGDCGGGDGGEAAAATVAVAGEAEGGASSSASSLSSAEASALVRCSALRVGFHRLAPAGVSEELLDGRFVRCCVVGEEGLLRFLGVEQPRRSAFLREHVFPRLSELGAAQRDGAMLAVVHGLHALCAEDEGFLACLRGLAFVPVASGALRCASALFHPQVQEAEELLDASEAFPAGAFADAEVLGYPRTPLPGLRPVALTLVLGLAPSRCSGCSSGSGCAAASRAAPCCRARARSRSSPRRTRPLPRAVRARCCATSTGMPTRFFISLSQPLPLSTRPNLSL